MTDEEWAQYMDCVFYDRTVNEKVSSYCTVEWHDSSEEPIESGDSEDSVTIRYTDSHHHELTRARERGWP